MSNEMNVAWAIDPLEGDAERMQKMAATIQPWQRNLNGKVTPVSILAPIRVNWPAEVIDPLNSKLVTLASKSLLPILREIKNIQIKDSHILVQPSRSHRDAVNALLEYCRREQVQMIAINTHGRRGLERLRLGSFAEQLIASSSLPVLTINSSTVSRSSVRSILFPTDFSQTTRAHFDQVVDWAERFQAEVLLAHYALATLLPFAYDEWGPEVDSQMIENVWHEQESAFRKTAETWINTADKRGVKCQFLYSAQVNRIGAGVLQTADKVNADLIVIGSHRGPLGQAMLGSIARDLVLDAKVPVVVMHTPHQQ